MTECRNRSGSILLDTHDFADGEPQSDDQTIMVITAN